MKLLNTIAVVVLLSVSSASALKRPRGGHDLSIPRRRMTTIKQGIAQKIAHKKNMDEHVLESPCATTTRGGAAKEEEKEDKNTSRLVLMGNVGNIVVVILSVVLLIKTLKVGEATISCERPNAIKCIVDDATGSNLDDCYICDGFCISNPFNKLTNSHMLSLYVDIIMTLPLAWLWFKRQDDLSDLGLNDYFLGSKRLFTVIGHGCGHLGLSLMEHGMPSSPGIFTGATLRYAIAGTALASHFITSKVLSKLKGLVGIVSTIEKDEILVRHLNTKVAPFLAPIAMTQHVVSSEGGIPRPVGNAILFGVMYILNMAGLPPPTNTTTTQVIAIGGAAAITYACISIIGDLIPPNGDPTKGAGLCFVMVFTSTLVLGSVAQLVSWDAKEKERRAKPYAITALSSNLLTTLVGWALALKCTVLKDYTGHALYDFSIPFSYLLIYVLTKYL